MHRSAGDADLYDQAKEIVRQVHACGVIHKDLARRNWVVVERGAVQGLFLIDFSHSVLSHDVKLQDNDLADLQNLWGEL